MLLAMYLTFGQVLGLPVPNPTIWLETVFGPVSDMIHQLLS